jgi:inner membrane protein
MDIITHTISGIATGSIIAAFSKSKKQRLSTLALSAIAGALPDFDAISLWSKFDCYIGSPLHLNHSGKEIYFSKFWYSHHAFMHSLLASLLICALLYFTIKITSNKSFSLTFYTYKYHMLAFVLAYCTHLIEDMPTPSCVWGGVNFMWPSKTYIGGTGQIWWWNNYDLFLIISMVVLINTILLLSVLKSYKTTLAIYLTGLGLLLYQINHRPLNFNYTGHSNKYDLYEKQSLEIQKSILGNTTYNLMRKFDNHVKVNF